MLHITNGSVVAALLRTLGLKGDIVIFHDVLHEGPVQAGLGLEALRASRAAFLAGSVGAERDQVLHELTVRDDTILRSSAQDEVVLWFEHDLFDQLQLLQVLDMLPNGVRPRITAVQPVDYLAKHSPAHLATLFTRRREVDESQRGVARAAWAAFRSSDPRALLEVIRRAAALPHLPAAFTRHLQQFPWMTNGLSRTEAQGLAAIANGASRMGDVFVQSHQEREEAVFMGDTGFLLHMRQLFESSSPLAIVVRRHTPTGSFSLEDAVALTEDGVRVLEGHADRVKTSGIDRWLGGVHLSGKGPMWRWDDAAQTIRLA